MLQLLIPFVCSLRQRRPHKMSVTEKLFGKAAAPGAATSDIFARKQPLRSTKASKPRDGDATAKGATGPFAKIDTAKLFHVAAPTQRETRRQRQQRELAERMKAAKSGGGVAVKDAGRKRHLSHGKDDHTEEDKRTVFVGNLPNDVHRRDLEKFFKKCGEVESVRVRCQMLEKRAENDKDRGRAVRILRGELSKAESATAIAYVLFKERSSVAAAVALSGSVLCGRHLSITTEDAEGKAFMPRGSLFLGNLAYDVSDEDVWKFFLDGGFHPVHVRVVRDRNTGLAQGIGFVSFASPESADEALKLRDGGMIRDRVVRICHVQKSKSMSVVPSRRERRKEAMRTQPVAGPQMPGGGGNNGSNDKKRRRGDASGNAAAAAAHAAGKARKAAGEEHPPWMGVATNPRKKLARDLRPLVEPPKSKEKRAKKGPPPPAKKKPAVAAASAQ